MTDPNHAWFVLAGVFVGLGIAAGAAFWVTRLVHRVIQEAREVIAEMRKVVQDAKKISFHVADQYAPLRDDMRNLRADVDLLRRHLGSE